MIYYIQMGENTMDEWTKKQEKKISLLEKKGKLEKARKKLSNYKNREIYSSKRKQYEKSNFIKKQIINKMKIGGSYGRRL